MDGRTAGNSGDGRTDGRTNERTAGNRGDQLRAARTDGNVFKDFSTKKLGSFWGNFISFFISFFFPSVNLTHSSAKLKENFAKFSIFLLYG
jgi:hypothetical protein